MTDPAGADRHEYDTPPLSVDDIGADPVAGITRWVDEAWRAGEPQANAMCLATVTPSGMPAARTVLLKGLDSGLVFFTNYNSAKGADLAGNATAAANFTWLTMHRQIRVVGGVSAVSPTESDEYFASRPRGAQIAATASQQSSPVRERSDLEAAFAEVEARYPDVVPRPTHWGGYRLTPVNIEFWQGRRNRLHDRFLYQRHGGEWTMTRLSP